VAVPWGINHEPDQSEPLGPMLALLGGLYEEDVAMVVAARGGLTGYRALLDSPFLFAPHDTVVPGALTTAGDWSDVAAALAPKPLSIAGLVDGVNRAATAEAAREYDAAAKAYSSRPVAGRFALKPAESHAMSAASWLLERL
jgi:hypothetical protein